MYLRCSTSRAKYYASVLLCDHPDRARGTPQRAGDCGLECCGVCLHVGTRRRICYTLVMRRARVYRCPEPERKREREPEREREKTATRFGTSVISNHCFVASLVPQQCMIVEDFIGNPFLEISDAGESRVGGRSIAREDRCGKSCGIKIPMPTARQRGFSAEHSARYSQVLVAG